MQLLCIIALCAARILLLNYHTPHYVRYYSQFIALYASDIGYTYYISEYSYVLSLIVQLCYISLHYYWYIIKFITILLLFDCIIDNNLN